MSEYNLDQKKTLKYVCQSLQGWGILINHSTLKKARDNSEEVVQDCLRLLFDLCVLHLTNYSYTIDQLDLQYESEQHAHMFILMHLVEVQCPMLKEVNAEYGLEFNSSRVLLLVSGWLMAVSAFFSHIGRSLIPNKLNRIHQHKHPPIATKPSPPLEKNLTELYNMYKNSLLRYSNLSNKKQRIIETNIKKVNKYNKSNHTNYSIEMVLEEDDSEEMVRMQEDVLELLDGQIGGMKHRAYWWVWLNQRVVKNEVTMLEELYEEIPYADIEIESSIEVDADYMNKFVRRFQHIQKQVYGVNIELEKYQEQKPKKPKQWKLLAKEVHDDYNHIQSHVLNQHKHDPIPTFIGTELKQYLKQRGHSKPINNIKQDTQQQQTLKQELSAFIAELSALEII